MSAFWVPRVNFCMVLDICNMDWEDRLYFSVCGDCSECHYHCWLSSMCVLMMDHLSPILCEVLGNSVSSHSVHVKCQHSYWYCTSPITHHDFAPPYNTCLPSSQKLVIIISPLQSTAGFPFCRSSFSEGWLSFKCPNSMYTVAQPLALSLCFCENLWHNCTWNPIFAHSINNSVLVHQTPKTTAFTGQKRLWCLSCSYCIQFSTGMKMHLCIVLFDLQTALLCSLIKNGNTFLHKG